MVSDRKVTEVLEGITKKHNEVFKVLADGHNLSKCNCNNCKKWWLKNIQQGPSGLLFELVPSLKYMPIDIFHRRTLIMLHMLFMDSDLKPYWNVYSDNKPTVMMR